MPYIDVLNAKFTVIPESTSLITERDSVGEAASGSNGASIDKWLSLNVGIVRMEKDAIKILT